MLRSKSKSKSKRRKASSKKSKTTKDEFKHLFDIDYIKRKTKNLSNLKTSLRKIRNKGVGIFANKKIKKNEVIVYYLLKAYNVKNFHNLFNNVYTIELYTKNGNSIKSLIGDLCNESLMQPDSKGIAYWGYFSNEPSNGQKENSFLDINLNENYMNKNRIKDGDYVLYKLIASKDIEKGEEITWCYGSLYSRNYETTCDEK